MPRAAVRVRMTLPEETEAKPAGGEHTTEQEWLCTWVQCVLMTCFAPWDWLC